MAPGAETSASSAWPRCLIEGPSPFTCPPFSSGGFPFCAKDSNKSVKEVEPCYSNTPSERALPTSMLTVSNEAANEEVKEVYKNSKTCGTFRHKANKHRTGIASGGLIKTTSTSVWWEQLV